MFNGGLSRKASIAAVSYTHLPLRKDCGTTAIDRGAGALLSFTICIMYLQVELNSNFCDANVI